MSTATKTGCSVFGLNERASPEHAVFANTTMIRQLDFNDYGRPGGGHPSDMIAAVLAAGEIANVTGAEFVRGIFIAYEVAAAVVASYPVENAGWDHAGTATAVGAAMGAGSVLGLEVDQLANAVGIAVTPSMNLGVTRKGELSNWKGSASALEAMNGLLAARLAQLGLTGPEAPFEGVGGLNSQVQPTRPLEFNLDPEAPTAVERSNIKLYPAVVNAQYLIGPLLNARKRMHIADIATVTIETFRFMFNNLGGGVGDRAIKWAPSTRETADHSLPYIVAVCLLDGDVTPHSFSPERIVRPDVRSLMSLITVGENAEFTAKYPEDRISTVRIDFHNGESMKISSETPPGGPMNPVSKEQLTEKFRGMSRLVMSEPECLELESILWGLATLESLNDLCRLYRALKST
jgi:2-methylcitrate dehydratase